MFVASCHASNQTLHKTVGRAARVCFFPPTPQYPREKKRRALGRRAWRGRQGSTALRLSPIGAHGMLAPSPRLSSARWGAPSHAKRKASVRLPEFYFFTAKLDPSVRHPSPIFSLQTKAFGEAAQSPCFFSAKLDPSMRRPSPFFSVQNTKLSKMQPKSPLHSSANEVKRMVVFIFQRAKR